MRRAICFWIILLTGCQRGTELEDGYGVRRGAAGQGVNGLAVFAQMFEDAGFRTSSWRRLSPRLEREQVLVWAPDRMTVPTQAEMTYLESWLASEPNRTLIYIGRDFDARIAYWRGVLPQLHGIQRIEAQRRLARAEAEQMRRLPVVQNARECRWFRRQTPAGNPTETGLAGPWSAGIERDDVRLEMALDLVVTQADADADWGRYYESESLLTVDGQTFVGMLTQPGWQGGKIIVVANGALVGNYGLTVAAHRQLAAKLIGMCNPPRVCFLESGDEELLVSETDQNIPLMLRVFTVYPVNVVMFHLLALGLVYAFSVLPVFGTPRHLPDDSVSDFGKHVQAVGELLERGQDESHARELVRQYREKLGSRK